jgi:hypothetical protein
MTKAVELAQIASTGVSEAFKNRIINGTMVLAQRSTSSVSNSQANSTLAYDTIDRWGYWAQNSNKFTTQQSSTAPAGFNNSALITSSTALSVEAETYYSFAQRIEGFNFADLGFGTANAKTFTVSFWVRSSITGTFPFYCFNSGYSRSYTSTFTINAVNTWEQKTITVVGDTTGTWLTTNGIGIEVGITLAAGSNWFNSSANTWTGVSYGLGLTGATNFLATNGATMNITGVQLEVGSSATSFEYRDYGNELRMCQRYCNVYGENIYSVFGTMGFAFSDTGFSSVTVFPVEMRVMPTVSYRGNTRAVSGSDSINITSVAFNTTNSSKKIALVEPAVASGLTTNRGYFWSAVDDATARAIFSAEL